MQLHAILNIVVLKYWGFFININIIVYDVYVLLKN